MSKRKKPGEIGYRKIGEEECRSGDLSWFVRIPRFRRRFAALWCPKPKIAIPAPIASFASEEHHDPLEKGKVPNRKVIRRTPGARHKLKIKHHVGDVQYLRNC